MFEIKFCRKCNIEFPATEEYFYKDKNGKYGLRGECKECTKNHHHNYYRNNIKYFKEANKKYSLENKETISQNNKNLYERKKVYIRQHQKEYYDNNRHNILLQKKDYMKKEDVVLNRRKNEQTREARKRNLEASLTPDQWIKCKEYFNNECCYCGLKLKLSQDHFVSISNNGEYTANNIIPSCKKCNSSKNDSYFFEWYPKQAFYSKKRERKILKYLNYDTKTRIQQLALI